MLHVDLYVIACTDITHALVTQVNILINAKRRACLSDFGLAAFSYEDRTAYIPTLSVNAGTMRWTAPEIMDPEEFGLERARPSRESDVYAVSMVMWEVRGASHTVFVCIHSAVSNAGLHRTDPLRGIDPRSYCYEDGALGESPEAPLSSHSARSLGHCLEHHAVLLARRSRWPACNRDCLGTAARSVERSRRAGHTSAVASGDCIGSST